ncbi:hypothetical protein [Streptomyces sp. NPDC050759]|uniref:hypothetical protein n=1 Tax=Streptomyces sp. NPDC050759 TaxID=3365635 RepID=UPI00378BD2D7
MTARALPGMPQAKQLAVSSLSAPSDTGAERQVHDRPDPRPAGPDELADQVIALRLGGRYDRVSPHL